MTPSIDDQEPAAKDTTNPDDSTDATETVLANIAKGKWWGDKSNKDGVTYRHDIPKFPADFRRILVDYAGLEDNDEVLNAHVNSIREQAWAEFAYPCIGMWSFIEFNLPIVPSFPSIRSRLLADPTTTLLDLGCCFGADLRLLRSAGVPAPQLHGVDIHARFFELGCALFRDPSFASRFSALDIFDAPATAGLAHRYDIVHASQLFHLFTRAEQAATLTTALRFLKPRAGSVLVGRQLGTERPGVWESKASPSGSMWANSLETWRETVDGVLAEMARTDGLAFKPVYISREALPPSWANKLGRGMGAYVVVFEIELA